MTVIYLSLAVGGALSFLVGFALGIRHAWKARVMDIAVKSKDDTIIDIDGMVVVDDPLPSQRTRDPLLPPGFRDNVRAADFPLTTLWLDETDVLREPDLSRRSPELATRAQALIALNGVAQLLRHHPSITPPTIVTRAAYEAAPARWGDRGNVMVIPDDLELVHDGSGDDPCSSHCVACRVIRS